MPQRRFRESDLEPRTFTESDLIPSEESAISAAASKIEAIRSPTLSERAQNIPLIGNILGGLLRHPFRTGGQIAGGTLGGIAGLGVGHPLIGGAIGQAGGEALGQLAETAIGKPMQSAASAAESIGIAGLGGLTGEAIGAGAIRALSPFAKSATKEGLEAVEFLSKVSPKKTGLLTRIQRPSLGPTPPQATESWIADIAGNIAEAGVLSGGIMRRAKDKAITFLDQRANNAAVGLATFVKPNNLGKAIVDTIENRFDVADAVPIAMRKSITDEVRQMVTKAPVAKEINSGILDQSGKPIIRTVITEVTEPTVKVNSSALRGFAIDEASPIRLEATRFGDPAINATLDLAKKQNWMDFDTAVDFRSRLISLKSTMKAAAGNVDTPGTFKVGELIKLTEGAIRLSLKDHAPHLLKDWVRSNILFRVNRERFRNDFIIGLVDRAHDAPEAVVGAIMGQGVAGLKGSITHLKLTHKALGNSPQRQMLDSYFLRDIISRSAGTDGKISGDKLIKLAFGKGETGTGGYTEDFMVELLGKSGANDIKQIGSALKVSQQPGPSGVGKIAIQLTQFGTAGVGGILTGSLILPGFVLGGPVGLAYMLTSPVTRKWLIQGLTLPRGSREAISAATRLSLFQARIDETLAQRQQPQTIQ